MIKFSIPSFLKGSRGGQEISFLSLTGKKEGFICRRKGCSCSLHFKVLTGVDKLLTLPKYHQKLGELKLDFRDYIAIYASVKDDYDRGCDIKIEKVYKEGNEIIVKVNRLVTNKEFCLEIITLPYDLVKVDKNYLPKVDKVKFKFLDSQDKLLYTEEVINAD